MGAFMSKEDLLGRMKSHLATNLHPFQLRYLDRSFYEKTFIGGRDRKRFFTSHDAKKYFYKNLENKVYKKMLFDGLAMELPYNLGTITAYKRRWSVNQGEMYNAQNVENYIFKTNLLPKGVTPEVHKEHIAKRKKVGYTIGLKMKGNKRFYDYSYLEVKGIKRFNKDHYNAMLNNPFSVAPLSEKSVLKQRKKGNKIIIPYEFI